MDEKVDGLGMGGGWCERRGQSGQGKQYAGRTTHEISQERKTGLDGAAWHLDAYCPVNHRSSTLAAIAMLRLRHLTPAFFLLLSTAIPTPSAPLQAQAAQREILHAKFARDVRRVAESFNGVLGVSVVDLTDSAMTAVNENLVFTQGSAIKVALLIELFRQAESHPALLRERIPMTAAARTGGSGVIANFVDGGSVLSVEDLAILMITLSDNSATNLLIDRVGMDSVNRTMKSLGLSHTLLQRKMIRYDAMLRGDENISTPAEAALLMVRIARCTLPVSAAACARIRQILEIAKDEPVRSVIPDSIRVASKPGDIEGVATSWALVDLPDRPFVLTVMTNYGMDGHPAIKELATLSLDYFSRLARSTPYGARVPLSVIQRRRRTP